MRTLGAILAGGRSSRFGRDKAVALLGGRRLIDRAADALAAQVDALVICGRTLPGRICVADRPAPDLGPLGGIAAALRHAADQGFDRVATLPCDTPLPPATLVADLARAGAGRSVFLADMPVVGLWTAGLADDLDRRLADPDVRRSVRGWALAAGAVPVAGGAGIANVNTPADLARLENAG